MRNILDQKELDWRAVFEFWHAHQVLFVCRGVSNGDGIYEQSLWVVSCTGYLARPQSYAVKGRDER